VKETRASILDDGKDFMSIIMVKSGRNSGEIIIIMVKSKYQNHYGEKQ